jgi:GAF domain-containing protein
MLTRIRQWLAPPIFEGDEDKTRTARLLNIVLWAELVAMLLVTFLIPFSEDVLVGAVAVGLITLQAVIMLFLMRAGYVQLAAGLFTLSLWLTQTGLVFVSGGIRSPMLVGYAVPVCMAGLFLGGRMAVVLTGLSIAAGVGVYYAELNGLLPAAVIPITPMAALGSLFGNMFMVAALLYLATQNTDEALDRARRNAAELEDERAHLEEAVVERTRDLSRRARYLETTAAIAGDTASVLDVQTLLSRAVDLITEQFGFYHTGLFLLDLAREWAVLRAASSEGGQRMLARGHRLQPGSGIVGRVVEQGTHRIALDVGTDAAFFDNPDLPDTRSEMALPLRARGEIIGVLDVQSTQPAAFSDEDVVVLQTLADQVALAISNARLFRQAQESLEAERRAYGELSREAWRELVRAQVDLGVLRDERGISHLRDAEAKQALGNGDDGTENLVVPIRVRGGTIGEINAHRPGSAGEWTAEEVALLQALVEQLGLALDGARLHQDTQRRAAQERMLGEVTARMRETLDVDEVLRTAVRQMRESLGIAEVEVHLSTDGK